jgi:hypothetical protein
MQHAAGVTCSRCNMQSAATYNMQQVNMQHDATCNRCTIHQFRTVTAQRRAYRTALCMCPWPTLCRSTVLSDGQQHASVVFVCLLWQSLALTPAPQPAPATKKVRPAVYSTASLQYNTAYSAIPRQYRVLRTVARAVLRAIPRVIPCRYRVKTACMPRIYRVDTALIPQAISRVAPRRYRVWCT